VARNYDLFALVPRLLNRRGHRYDLPKTFRAITGLAIEDYVGLGFGLLSHYDTIEAGLIAATTCAPASAPRSPRPCPRGSPSPCPGTVRERTGPSQAIAIDRRYSLGEYPTILRNVLSK
jgi:hypothetical protein